MTFSDHAKLTTCSYCGTRSILKLAHFERHHELACTACGAPIHLMKPIKLSRPEPKPARVAYHVGDYNPRIKKKKRKRSFNIDWEDLIEDFFEEIFD